MAICYPLLAGDWLQSEWSRMTLSGDFMSKSFFREHFLSQSVWLSKIIAWKVTNIASCYQWQKCKSTTLVSGSIYHFYIFKSVSQILSPNWSGVVKTDEFAVFPMHVFVSFGNNVDMVVHYDNNLFWISADTNKDDLEWPWMPNSS